MDQKISFRTTSCSSKLFGPEEDSDEGKQRDEGAALAKQFYDQLKKREDLGEEQKTTGNVSPRSEDVTQSPDSVPTKKPKKFTGKPPKPTPSRNDDNGNTFFSASSSSNNSVGGNAEQPQRQTPREQMMEREFNLVGRAEKGLKYQAVLAVAVAIFYLYVGLTGGIKSGDTDYYDAGNDDTIVEELMIPVPRDTEASYWL